MITFKKLINTLLLSTLVVSNYSMAEVSVVVHPDNANTISSKDVKRIFSGKNQIFSRWLTSSSHDSVRG